MKNTVSRIIELEDDIQCYSYQLSKGAPIGTYEKKSEAIKELKELCKRRRQISPPQKQKNRNDERE
jgi:hypothetical protein